MVDTENLIVKLGAKDIEVLQQLTGSMWLRRRNKCESLT